MKNCSRCGSVCVDEAVLCVNCGCAFERTAVSGLKKAAKVLMIISTVFLGLYILPLAWCLPMTISYSKSIKKGKRIGTGFKVCTLLFVNLIAGILLLCDDENKII